MSPLEKINDGRGPWESRLMLCRPPFLAAHRPSSAPRKDVWASAGNGNTYSRRGQGGANR